MSEEALARFAGEVSKLMPAIMREFLKRQAKEITRGSLTLPQLLILDTLREKGSMRMGELAEFLGVSMAAATGVVERLVNNGLSERAGSPGDRRVVNISITAKGSAIVEKHTRARLKATVDLFQNLSPPDRDKYLEILQKINRHLKEKK